MGKCCGKEKESNDETIKIITIIQKPKSIRENNQNFNEHQQKHDNMQYYTNTIGDTNKISNIDKDSHELSHIAIKQKGIIIQNDEDDYDNGHHNHHHHNGHIDGDGLDHDDQIDDHINQQYDLTDHYHNDKSLNSPQIIHGNHVIGYMNNHIGNGIIGINANNGSITNAGHVKLIDFDEIDKEVQDIFA